MLEKRFGLQSFFDCGSMNFRSLGEVVVVVKICSGDVCNADVDFEN